MPEEILENATDALKRELTSRFALINWKVAGMSEEMTKPHRELQVKKTDSELKHLICDFVILASFNEGFHKDVQKMFRPYQMETSVPRHERKRILLHARRTIILWSLIANSLRRRKIIVLPGE